MSYQDHPDLNILMTALDSGQRYLRLDDQDGQGTINVPRVLHLFFSYR